MRFKNHGVCGRANQYSGMISPAKRSFWGWEKGRGLREGVAQPSG